MIQPHNKTHKMKITQRTRKDSKQCTEGWRMKLITDLREDVKATPLGQDTIILESFYSTYRMSMTRDEAEKLARKLMATVHAMKEDDLVRAYEFTLQTIASQYLQEYAVAIQEGNEDAKPLMTRDWPRYAQKHALPEIEVLKKEAVRIIRNRLDCNPEYMAIAKDVAKRVK